MKFKNILIIAVVVILLVLSVGGYKYQQTKAASNAPSVVEIIPTDVEQKPIIEIFQAKQQLMRESDSQTLGMARMLATQKGIEIGQEVGKYSVSQEKDGRIKFTKNTAPAQQSGQ